MQQIRAMKPDSKGRYYFIVPFASAELMKKMSLEFIDTQTGDKLHIHDYHTNTVVDTISCTSADVAIRLMNKNGTSVHKIMSALLVYGGNAQVYFEKTTGVNMGEPAYNLLSQNAYEIPSIDHINAGTITSYGSITGADIGIYKSSESAGLDAAINQRVYFTLKDGHDISEYTFELTYINPDGSKSTKTVTPTYQSGKNRYYVIIPDIASAYLDYMYTVCVTSTATNEKYTVKTGITNWVKTTLEDTNADAVKHNMAKAIYYFNQAANEYFGR